ncbi:MAG: hypothetical protein RRY36_06420 [Bacteroidaceae bacterium]
MKGLLLSILYFTLAPYYLCTCKALDVYQFVDARSYSMGNTVSILPGFANPSSYAFSSTRCASLQYLNRYGLKELSTYAGGVNVPNKYLDAGLYIARFGFSAYNETLLSLNCYKRLSDYISLGIRISYFSLHYTAKESNAGAVTGDIGITIRPMEHFLMSVVAANPLQTKVNLGERRENLPVVLSVGMSYELAESFLLTAEVEKDFEFPVVYKFGMEYNPIKQLSIRAGLSGKPFVPAFGVGVHLGQFTVDIAFNRHSVLGFRSCCGLQFNF